MPPSRALASRVTRQIIRQVSVFVVVTLMGGVTTAVVDIVDVVAVRDGDMAATITVHMVMPLMDGVLAGLAIVIVAVVRLVQVSVVDVVDVVAVWDGNMPTPLAVGVLMANVFGVPSGHFDSSSPRSLTEPFSAPVPRTY